MFLRYSLAQFLRFWLARLIYEQQTQTDRIVNEVARVSCGRSRNGTLLVDAHVGRQSRARVRR